MAVRLQSWWRMLMVMKGMGPFKRITTTGGGASAKKVSTAGPGSKGGDSSATQSRKSTRSAK